MIPQFEQDVMNNIEIEQQPTNTYKLNMKEDSIQSHTNGLEAMRQAIYKIINTERYKYLIYSWDYGVELSDLFGKPVDYCYSEIKRRITEGLLQDDRIEAVDNFEFSHSKGNVLAKFRVITTEGELQVEKVVNIA